MPHEHTQDHPWRAAPHRLALRTHQAILRAAATLGIETWGDAGHLLGSDDAERLAACRAFAQQTGARGFNIYGGGRFAYLGGGSAAGWTPGVAAGLAAEGFGLFMTWVSLEPGQGGYDLGVADGRDAVRVAKADYPAVRILSWDVEPATWWANIAGVTDAMRGFHDAIHQAGYLDMPYGWEATCAAAAPWADRLWVASPGYTDPAHLRPQLPDDVLVGRRSVQYGWVNVGGTDWDISHSEFSLSALGAPASLPGGTMLYNRPDGGLGCVFVDPDGVVHHFWGDQNPDDPADATSLAGPGAMKTDLGQPATQNEPFRAVAQSASALVLPDGSTIAISAIERGSGKVFTVLLKPDGTPLSPWRPVTDAVAGIAGAAAGGVVLPGQPGPFHQHDSEVDLDGTKVTIRSGGPIGTGP